jgi:5,10-methylenetetrahydromethanopterin reductase
MRAHTRGDSQQATTLTDDFIDRFAIVGPPETCIRRFEALAKLGLERIATSGATRGADANDAAVGRALFEKEVLQAVRAV